MFTLHEHFIYSPRRAGNLMSVTPYNLRRKLAAATRYIGRACQFSAMLWGASQHIFAMPPIACATASRCRRRFMVQPPVDAGYA